MTIFTNAVGTTRNGTHGFDCDQPISAALAQAAVVMGYRFAVRYVRRRDYHDYDLTTEETKTIVDNGLGLMVVQHVAPENWTPSAGLGMSYGRIAAEECVKIGIPAGVTVWCDMEGVNTDALEYDAITYANAWYDAVFTAGYTPGVYLGWHPGVGNRAAFRSLKFRNYWRAYNGDVIPDVRGFQMRQFEAKKEDLIPGFKVKEFDVNIIDADKLGGTPNLMFPTVIA
jgi:hypothetical protein